MFTTVALLLVTVQFLQYVNGNKQYPYSDPNPIKYPGPTKDDQLTNRFSSGSDVEVPPECIGKDFCTVKPKNYPQDKFNWLLRNYTFVPSASLVPMGDLDDRQANPALKDDCDVKVTYKPLYMVREKGEAQYRTVVQAPDVNYVQRVRLEECKDTKKSCFKVFAPVEGVRTSCVQKYNVWEVLVSDGKDGTVPVKAELPVCCSCMYET